MIELSYRARPFPGSRCVASVYKLEDDDAAGEISPAGGVSLPRIISAEAIRSDFAAEPLASGCIFHTSYAAPYLHHGLVISLEYNRPRDRHRSCCCSPVCRPESLIAARRLPRETSNLEWGMRNVRDRKIAMMEKALIASTFTFEGCSRVLTAAHPFGAYL